MNNKPPTNRLSYLPLQSLLLGFVVFLLLSACSPSPPRLINWTLSECDQSYDPYLLQDRISHIERVDDTTRITVHFADHCHIDLQPQVILLKNKLQLIADGIADLRIADCYCCFSLIYEISGLPDTLPPIYFKDTLIPETNEPYAITQEETFETHDGQKINKTNKFGLKEGIWKYFSEENQLEDEFYFDGVTSKLTLQTPQWAKKYHPNGQIAIYSREDTVETWDAQGNLISRKTGRDADPSPFHLFIPRDL